MLTTIIITALRLVPGIPGWVPPLVGAIVPAAIQIVKDLEASPVKSSDKFSLAVAELALVLDASFDAVPAWADLKESQRDVIIAGLVELALFASRMDPNLPLAVP